jgi:integrase
MRQRSPGSWELKVEIGRAPDGSRRTETRTHKGSKRSAKLALATLVAEIGKGAHADKSSLTLAQHVAERIDTWRALGKITRLTAEGYQRLLRCQMTPTIGAIALQSLEPADIERWHGALLTSGRSDGLGGLSSRTITHAHRLLTKSLREAGRDKLIVSNPIVGVSPPKVPREEIEILSPEEVRLVTTELRGHPIYAKAIVSLFTGLRRSEILALRWGAIDWERKSLRVTEALEETTAGGLAFKCPKSDAGKRTVTLPDVAIDVLREQRRRQLEQRMALGMGRAADDMLVFSRLDGSPSSPRALSKEWRLAAASIGVKASFHSLRHVHVSHLVNAGIDPVRISKRIGHADVSTTLNTYSHLFDARPDRTADLINDAVAELLK